MKPIWKIALALMLAGGALGANAQTYLNFNISQPPQLLADAGNDDILCEGDTILLGGTTSASGGTPAYTYAWSGISLLSTNVPNPMANPQFSTFYVLTVTDNRNCSVIDTVNITVDTCVGISDPLLPIQLSVYPNPSDGNFKVVLDGNSDGESLVLRITDLLGREVDERSLGSLQGHSEQAFDLKMLSSGTYYLRVMVGEHAFQRQIIIR